MLGSDVKVWKGDLDELGAWRRLGEDWEEDGSKRWQEHGQMALVSTESQLKIAVFSYEHVWLPSTGGDRHR